MCIEVYSFIIYFYLFYFFFNTQKCFKKQGCYLAPSRISPFLPLPLRRRVEFEPLSSDLLVKSFKRKSQAHVMTTPLNGQDNLVTSLHACLALSHDTQKVTSEVTASAHAMRVVCSHPMWATLLIAMRSHARSHVHNPVCMHACLRTYTRQHHLARLVVCHHRHTIQRMIPAYTLQARLVACPQRMWAYHPTHNSSLYHAY